MADTPPHGGDQVPAGASASSSAALPDSGASVQGVAASFGGGASAFGLIPDVATAREIMATRKTARGKRSASHMEIMEEHRSDNPVTKMTRAEAAKKARDAKAKKAAMQKQTEVPGNASATTLVLASSPVVNLQTELDEETMGRIAAGPTSVFGASPLVELLVRLQGTEQKPDGSLVAIVDDLCRTPRSTVSTLVARAERLDVEPKDIRENLPQIACVAINCDHGRFRSFVDSAVGSNMTPLLYLEVALYDETPMTVRNKEAVYAIVAGGSGAGPHVDQQRPQGMVKWEKKVVSEDTGPTKLFQTNMAVLVLFKDETPGSQEHCKYFVAHSQPLTTVQYLESTCAEVLKAALQASSCTPASANAFPMVVRVATSDRYAANLKAERHLNLDRGAEWLSLFSPCDVHSVAGAQTKTLALLGEFVSHMVNLSLSLRLTGNMRKFRSCLQKTIRAKLKLLQGKPPPSADAYKRDILNVFLARGPRAAERRMSLLVWLNGDWRNHNNIEHYLVEGHPEQNLDSIADQVTSALVSCLATRAPKTFPRSRWTGSDLATDEVGLMMAVHGILLHAYSAFLIACGHKGAREFAASCGRSNAVGIGALELPEEVESPQALHDMDEGKAAGDHGTNEGASGQVGAEAAVGAVDWKALNAKFRSGGFAFIRCQPLGKTIVLRRCIEPFRVMLAQHFRLASEKWETEQRAKDAAALKPGSSSAPREYRVTIAASCKLEFEFIEKLKALLSQDHLWQCLPPSCKTMGFRALVFRLLSRAGCAIQQLLVLPHSQFPFRLFLLLEDDSLADFFQDAAECETDKFTRAFIDRFGPVGLNHPDALMTLKSIALVWKMDISEIEAKHASLRRLLQSTPQTKAMSSEALSAMWTCHRLAKRQVRFAGAGVKKTQLKKKSPAQTKIRRKLKRSAWQAFLSAKADGALVDTRALSPEYRNLTKAELEKYQKKADKATILLRHGLRTRHAFSNRMAAALVVAKRVQKEATWLRRQAGMSDAERLERIMEEVLNRGETGTTAVTSAKKEAFLEASFARKAEARAIEPLANFRQEMSTARLAEVCDKFGQPPSSLTDLVPFPSSSATCIDFVPDSASMATKVLAQVSAEKTPARLPMALTLDWARRCKTFSAQGLQPLEDRPKHVVQQERCRLAGECLCSPQGKVLSVMANKFLAYMKSIVKRQPKNFKDLLLEGKLVAAFIPAKPPPGGRRDLPELPRPDFASDLTATWVHIGLQYLKPYRPTFQCLVRSDKAPFMDGGIALKGLGDFKTLHNLLVDFDMDNLWWCCLFRLWESDEPVPDFVPTEICVQELAEPGLFWLGPLRRASGGPRPPRSAPQEPGGDMLPLEDGQDEEEPEVVEEDVPDAEADGEEGSADEQDDDMRGRELLAEMLEQMLDEEPDLGGIPEVAPDDNRAEELGEDHLPTSPVRAAPPGYEEDLFGDEMHEGVAGAPEPLAGPEPALAPPPPAPPVPRAFLGRGKGLHHTEFRGGFITFYPERDDPSKGRFQATCGNTELHGNRCRLTRTCNAPRNEVTAPGQGRPLGLLAAWLKHGSEEFVSTAEDHQTLVELITLEQRQEAREELLNEANAMALAACERPQRPGEGLEPEMRP